MIIRLLEHERTVTPSEKNKTKQKSTVIKYCKSARKSGEVTDKTGGSSKSCFSNKCLCSSSELTDGAAE